jgi:hypothetical protein
MLFSWWDKLFWIYCFSPCLCCDCFTKGVINFRQLELLACSLFNWAGLGLCCFLLSWHIFGGFCHLVVVFIFSGVSCFLAFMLYHSCKVVLLLLYGVSYVILLGWLYDSFYLIEMIMWLWEAMLSFVNFLLNNLYTPSFERNDFYDNSRL